LNSEEGPPTVLKLLFERKDAAKYGSVTETAQLIPSYETCVELRRIRIDETGIPIGARNLIPHS